MRRAEMNAADGNDSTREEAAEEDAPIVHLTPGRAMIVGLVPIGFVILATFVGLYITGMRAVGHSAPLFELLGSADSAAVLLGSSFLGMLVASLLAGFVGRIPVAEISEGLIDGIRAMVPAMVILLLAWSLGEVTTRLGTASFVIEAVSGNLPPGLLPATLFIVASVTAFSTGTSWGAMAILIPIAIPLAHQLPLEAGSSVAVTQGVLLGSVGAVLAGAVFGDHCSPISDTTILSSMASGCRHIDHVNTQIPYALLAGGTAIVFGYLPSGFGVPPWIGILLGGVLLFLLPRLWPVLSDSGGNGAS